VNVSGKLKWHPSPSFCKRICSNPLEGDDHTSSVQFIVGLAYVLNTIVPFIRMKTTKIKGLVSNPYTHAFALSCEAIVFWTVAV